MTQRTYTKEEKLDELRRIMREAAAEARGERDRDDAYIRRIANPFAGARFDGFETAQTDWRKTLSEAILYTDAATLLDEVIA
ncbi:hypothetical protein SEA_NECROPHOXINUS_26 [Microbacterium phage Necrophoxinus]|nr:hypothetical protein SEA_NECROPHOXINUS_26 [Microbacterium phage Necrophoxinus]